MNIRSIHRTSDGREFSDYKTALDHEADYQRRVKFEEEERRLKEDRRKKMEKEGAERLGLTEIAYRYITNTYYGKDLLNKYKLEETGTWEVKGEDHNCDLGGPHHMPDLGYFKGTIRDVLNKVTNMERFWTWGGGGEIRKYKGIVIEEV